MPTIPQGLSTAKRLVKTTNPLSEDLSREHAKILAL